MKEFTVPVVEGYLDSMGLLASLERFRKASEPVRLYLPAGEVRVRSSDLPEQFVALSNNDSGMKRIAFPLCGLRGVEIVGEGTRLVFEGGILPFDLNGCDGVKFEGFSIDFERPFHFEGKVVAVDADAEWFEVQPSEKLLWEIRDGKLWWVERPLDEGSRAVWHRVFGRMIDDARWERTLGWNIWMDPNERAVARESVKSLFSAFDPGRGRAYRAEAVEGGRLRIHHAGYREPPQVGWILVDKGAGGNRNYPAFHMRGSRNIVLKDVTIHHADGMGLIAEFCENIDLEQLRVLPSDGRAISTTADATHFVYCRGRIRIRGCQFENMPDDGVNVHGNYYLIKRVDPDGRVWIAPRHPQHEHVDFASVGDRIAVIDRETFQIVSEHLVNRVERLNGERIALDCEPPLEMSAKDRVLENLSWQAEFEMRDSVVRGNRARAVLFSTRGNGRIEGNRFENQSMSAFLLEMDADYWNETGPTGSVEIIGNTILGPAREFTHLPAIKITPELGDLGIPPLHGRIRIEGNQLVVDHPNVLAAGSVQDLTVSGNSIQDRSGAGIEPVKIAGCPQVTCDLEIQNPLKQTQQ